MDPAKNPYAPGAGTPPPLLAGRDDLVRLAEIALSKAKAGLPAKSFVATGLRGVGKTVILNRVQDIADEQGYQTAYIEAVEDAPLVNLLVPHLRKVLFKLDRMAATTESVRKSIRVLKGFAAAFRVHIGGVEIGIDPEFGVADSGDLASDLPELLIAVGEAAAARGTATAFIIDEIQYFSESDLRALIGAVHRLNQKNLPVLMVGAGLPQILGKMGDAKSYAERLFEFPAVTALQKEDAIAAIEKPARAYDVIFEQDALEEIVNITKGYPYFLQEWGFVTWNVASQSPITRSDVVSSHHEATRRLDEGFFRVRLDRMTPTERRYMRAMSDLGPGAHQSGDIARAYGAKVTTVAPIRSNLIGKGMIYSPAHGMTEFTVPLFDEFMRREVPAIS